MSSEHVPLTPVSRSGPRGGVAFEVNCGLSYKVLNRDLNQPNDAFLKNAACSKIFPSGAVFNPGRPGGDIAINQDTSFCTLLGFFALLTLGRACQVQMRPKTAQSVICQSLLSGRTLEQPQAPICPASAPHSSAFCCAQRWYLPYNNNQTKRYCITPGRELSTGHQNILGSKVLGTLALKFPFLPPSIHMAPDRRSDAATELFMPRVPKTFDPRISLSPEVLIAKCHPPCSGQESQHLKIHICNDANFLLGTA